ncbi:DNA-methyltransferase [Crossiella sp. CA198]|uniref:DNA-methyltransferase n=1 Tax=Crossiella sp. CA198 TaxID=3455607 RepID=UPI003F8D2F49
MNTPGVRDAAGPTRRPFPSTTIAPTASGDHARHTPAAYHLDRDFTLYAGDALRILRGLDDSTADCAVTSPPYWRLRDYATAIWTGGAPDCPHPSDDEHLLTSASQSRRCRRCGATSVDGQYGLESTPAAYIDTLRQVFAEVRRVLTPAGTLWLNLGDSYSANSDGYWCAQPGQDRQPRFRPAADVPVKNLVGMPWRVAFALQDDGWILRNAIIWHKPNSTPTPVRDRLACRHELLFLLTRQARYHFDLDPIRQPVVSGGPPCDIAQAALARGKNPGDVWSIPTRPQRHAHPAAFPIELPLRCIAASCPPAGMVLDPFSGTGTTGLAARHLHRRYIGIDLNPAFHDIALGRLRPDDRAVAKTRQHGDAERVDGRW